MVGEQREILPGESATVDVVTEGVWPLGRVSTEVVAAQQPVGEDPVFLEASLTAERTAMWAPPWTQLGLVLLLIVVVLVWRKWRAVRRARLEKALAEARAAGAREAGAGATPDGGAPVTEPSPEESEVRPAAAEADSDTGAGAPVRSPH